MNSFDDYHRAAASAMSEGGVKPELECFDPGTSRRGAADRHGRCSSRRSILVHPGGDGRHPAHGPQPRVHMASRSRTPHLEGHRHPREQWDAGRGRAVLGGNIRVGLEDNFYLSDGQMAGSNGDLVEKAVRMARRTRAANRPLWTRRGSCSGCVSFYVELGDGRFQATRAHDAGRGTRSHQHAGPPSALLMRELERIGARTW